jgi:hypothetical protein
VKKYKCKKCNKEKLYKDFSEHKQCKLGIDTSACKLCKKSAVDWKKVPLEKRIFNRVKSRAKNKNIEFNLELEDIILPEKCPIFNKDFIYGDNDWTYSVDRINNFKGYLKDNIQIISNRANRLKGDFSVEELRLIVNYLENL